MIFQRRIYIYEILRERASLIIQKGIRMFLAKRKLQHLKSQKELHYYKTALRRKIEEERRARETAESQAKQERINKRLELEMRQKEHDKYMSQYISQGKQFARMKTPEVLDTSTGKTSSTANTKGMKGMNDSFKSKGSKKPKEEKKTDSLGSVYAVKNTVNLFDLYRNRGKVTVKAEEKKEIMKAKMAEMTLLKEENMNYDNLYKIFSKEKKI